MLRVRPIKSLQDVPPEKVETPKFKAPASFKVFYIDKSLVENGEENSLKLEYFYHPGKNSLALFITRESENFIMEVIEFAEPRRSWLINNDLCPNGKIYMTTPIDVTFLALHHIRKYCAAKAMELETIHDDKDSSVKRLMTKFMGNASLNCIADVKTFDDMTFYKYNENKTFAWLRLKAKRLADALKNAGIHCGRSALSQNYMRSEKAAEEPVQDIDFLRMATDIIGGYLDEELHRELVKSLNIPTDTAPNTTDDDGDENTKKGKRKSITKLKAIENKKIKIDDGESSSASTNTGAIGASDSNNQFDQSIEGEVEEICVSISPESIKPLPLRERVLTAKEKRLAIGAKGTKSIASFFRK